MKIIEVPHIEGLHIPEILEFASKHWYINSYLLEYECEKYSSRNWIWNVGKLDVYANLNSKLFDPHQVQRLCKWKNNREQRQDRS